MRVPNAVHAARPLRIHEIAPDFVVEDVWALPTVGGAGDFPTLLDVFANLDFPSSTSLPTAYMAFIKPFRYLVVYPALMRHIERAWADRVARPRRAVAG